ncbi:hypothetical protein PG994_006001 [Apiospora phragmitis]|uniref:Uncharacterized protein n=1 Tax=Apiospora phragmitis TaxID=2905665 RepID=A0ABR1VDU4_9PEZI
MDFTPFVTERCESQEQATFPPSDYNYQQSNLTTEHAKDPLEAFTLAPIAPGYGDSFAQEAVSELPGGELPDVVTLFRWTPKERTLHTSQDSDKPGHPGWEPLSVCVQEECAYLSTESGQAVSRTGRKDTSNIRLQVVLLVIGRHDVADEAARLLAQNHLFLQQPHENLNVHPYFNPHSLHIPELLQGAGYAEEVSRHMRDEVTECSAHGSTYDLSGPGLVDLILNIDEFYKHVPGHDYLQEAHIDGRIRTPLKGHQKVAVDFMLRRESGVSQSCRGLWATHTSDDGLPVTLPNAEAFVKQDESRARATLVVVPSERRQELGTKLSEVELVLTTYGTIMVESSSSNFSGRKWRIVISLQPDEILAKLQQAGQAMCFYCSADIESLGDMMNAYDSGILTQCSNLVCSDCLSQYHEEFTALLAPRCPICKFEHGIAELTPKAHDAGLNTQRNFPTKVRALVEDVQTHSLSKKCLIFSFWKKTLDMIGQALENRGLSYLRVDGNMSAKKRNEALHQFQRNSSCRILMMTFSTGGVGLNGFTVANRIYIMEPQWNPAMEQQAIGRVLRIDQDQPVTVIVQSKQLRKLQLASGGFRAGEDGSQEQPSMLQQLVMALEAQFGEDQETI